MKYFFVPDDFELIVPKIGQSDESALAEFCNAKLWREGKVVYGYQNFGDGVYQNVKTSGCDVEALLINIQSIEEMQQPNTTSETFEQAVLRIEKEVWDKFGEKEKPCEHPKEKVTIWTGGNAEFSKAECECGAHVEPVGFREAVK